MYIFELSMNHDSYKASTFGLGLLNWVSTKSFHQYGYCYLQTDRWPHYRDASWNSFQIT